MIRIGAFSRQRVSLLLVAAVLIGITAAQVSALWKHPPPSSAPARATESYAPAVALPVTEEELLRKVSERLRNDPDDLEAGLLKGLLDFKSGDLSRALAELDRITRIAPKFHLAHLIRGDLLLVQVNQASDIGRNGIVIDLARHDEQQLERLRTEAEARLQGYLTLIDGQRVPRSLLLLAPDIHYALLVDKAQHRLYVYENAGADRPPRLMADYYCVIGKMPGNKAARGDQRTPEGIYFITHRIPDEKLPDRYGMAAYPLNYPNELDTRLGKTGDGIWLHGTDKDFYSRPPLDSDGCIVLANDDLQRVSRFIQPGVTPVVIADRLDWISPEEWRDRRESVLADLEGWRRDWESNAVEKYLSYYARDFSGDGLNLQAWSARKKQVARGKQFQKVRLDALTLLAYPPAAANGREMVVANFQQDYRSNNFSSTMGKRLYLVRDASAWKIWHEGRQ